MKRTALTKMHSQMVEEWKHEPEFKAACDELESEYVSLREFLLALQRSGLA